MPEDNKRETTSNKKLGLRVTLPLLDILIFALVALLVLGPYCYHMNVNVISCLLQCGMVFVCIFCVRKLMRIYHQIWRYGGIECYIRLIISDVAAFIVCCIVEAVLPIERIDINRLFSFWCANLLCDLSVRMIYRYAYKHGYRDDGIYGILKKLLKLLIGDRVAAEADQYSQKIKIAIIGTDAVGVSLADSLLSDPKSKYLPRCFIDNDPMNVGNVIHGIAVLSDDRASLEVLKKYHIQEIVFASAGIAPEKNLALFEQYHQAGFGIRVFDTPPSEMLGQRHRLREFSVEDLLMREQKKLLDEPTCAYYRDKVILVTGGGGSIGSELCRQLAGMGAKHIVAVDICENGAYELQQEILLTYHGKVDVKVEIASITNKEGLARIFDEYHPSICIHAAAHKHVPLMEKNCIEAVRNNVFGTLNVIQLCEEYGCGRFIMVSTDKAVNPTNIMGATKRVCEMIMQAYSTRGKVLCSATRFGNVLGSAGSVIPLFKQQIAAGGPVTLTDKRIIRYFMTIPEASQLVLTSGAMAKNGELFVLDMGKPIRILDLAKNMILLSGADGIEIVETGLRPGEKLYEELLVKSDTLQRTDRNMIFVEREEPVTMERLEEKLELLRSASTSDSEIRRVMRTVVPTYRTPGEVNDDIH